eukprot:TRINITY_DN1956_c0_g1_i5.p1 TRINITY_DN1956_c0_g1~~TRINITY_DN1956_c0_g1_i5.p1  ORF type:complete len:526 (-),score=131.84 TRINITY_DN1956_c0_g1_i5:45-1622(-)
MYCFFFFFFNDTATTEIYTRSIVGSVRCVQETVSTQSTWEPGEGETTEEKKEKEETEINSNKEPDQKEDPGHEHGEELPPEADPSKEDTPPKEEPAEEEPGDGDLEEGEPTDEIPMKEDDVDAQIQPDAEKPQPGAEDYIMPTTFAVEIHLEDNQIRIVNVEVEKAGREKPYLGGFVNKKNGLTYYNAFAQTDQYERPHPTMYHREVQTYQYKTETTYMVREFSAQTPRPGLSIDSRKDKVLEAKPYFTSEMWLKQREENTLYLQRMVRGWEARRLAAKERKEKHAKENENKERAEELRKIEEENHKKEIERRMHPKSAEDFEILRNELDAWRENETKKIKDAGKAGELSEEEMQKALHQLLIKETKLLQTIDRLKNTATVINREERIDKMLKAMSAPKMWKRTDGRFTEVTTPLTTRAKELMELYNGLKMPFLSIDERLDILLHVKWTVNEFDCSLTRDIVDLIDREADMLNRGRSEKSLEGLRKRLCNLFLQFIETVEFNPEAKNFQKVPREMLQQTQTNLFE